MWILMTSSKVVYKYREIYYLLTGQIEKLFDIDKSNILDDVYDVIKILIKRKFN